MNMAPPDPRCPPGREEAVGVTVASRWADADGTHIDVRGLAPPQPLVEILRLVESLPRDAVLIVHHDREPMLLYPELAERGWLADALDAPAGEVRLRLHADSD